MTLIDKRYKWLILLALSGLLTGAVILFPRLGVFEWISLIPVALFLLTRGRDHSVKYREVYLFGVWFFSFFYFVVIHWFTYMYPLDFVGEISNGAAIAIVLLAWIGLSIVQGVVGGFVFLFSAIMLRSKPCEKFPLIAPLCVSSAWVVLEWVQTKFFWAMPYGRLAIGQTAIPVGIQSASLFGSYFVSFLIVAVNFYACMAIISALKCEKGKRLSGAKPSVIALLVVLLFNYGAGTVLWLVNADRDSDKSITVAAVQCNISSSDTWDSTLTMDIHREYTLSAAEQGADVVLWSETALPYTVKEGNSTYKYISCLSREAQVEILAGVFTKGENGESYNSLVHFTADGEMSDAHYSKWHLVPFGEYVPIKGAIETLFPTLAELVIGGSDLEKGSDSGVISTEKGDLGAAICFDAMYEDVFIEEARDGAELFCISSNDSWFDDSAVLELHNAHIKLRAVECGRYAIHAANTGVSTVITNRGELVQRTDALSEEMIVRELPLKSGRTLYSYVGNLFVYLCLLTVAALCTYCAYCRIIKYCSEKQKYKA